MKAEKYLVMGESTFFVLYYVKYLFHNGFRPKRSRKPFFGAYPFYWCYSSPVRYRICFPKQQGAVMEE